MKTARVLNKYAGMKSIKISHVAEASGLMTILVRYGNQKPTQLTPSWKMELGESAKSTVLSMKDNL